MRLSLAAACSLGALSVCQPNAIAKTTSTPNSAPTPDQNWVVPTKTVPLANTVTITPPATIVQPETSVQTVTARRPEVALGKPPAPPMRDAVAVTDAERMTPQTTRTTGQPMSAGRASDLQTTARSITPPAIVKTPTVAETPAPTQVAARLPDRQPAKSAVAAPANTTASHNTTAAPPAKTEKSASRLNLPNFVIETAPVTTTPEAALIAPPMTGKPVSPPIAEKTPDTIARENPTPTKPTPTPTASRPTPIAPDLAVTVLDVKITGVDTEIQSILRSRLATQPGRQTSVNQIQQDIATMLGTELVNSATFTTQVLDNGINVSFNATPVMVRNIELRNAKVITSQVANGLFQDQFGQPLQPSKLDQGVRAVNQWYSDNGYSLSRAIDVEPNRNGTLKLTVKEGTINAINVRFVDEFGRTVDDDGKAIKGKTKESFIRQEIKSQPGEIFQISQIQQDLKNLLKTGLFVNAGVTIEGTEDKPNVVYNIAEGANRQANIGGGFSSDAGLFGSATYQDNNLGGTGNQLGGRVLLGSKDLQFNGKFTRPFRESDPQRWGYSINAFRERGASRVFDDDILLANGDQVREGRIGAGIGLTKALGNDWNGTIDLGYTRTSQRDASGNVVQTDAAGNPLSLSGRGIDDQVTLGFSAGFNQVDNPFDPKSGSKLTLSTQQGLPIGTGSSAANKLTADFSQYVPVNIFNQNNTNRDKQEVFAFNVQGGTTIGNLAPYNAFTLGGVDSVRGYGQGELGVGRSYIQASAEYRFPLISSLGGTLFADFASDLGSALLVPGEPGLDRNRPGAGFGVGAGLRYRSPIGILRADWGFTDSGTNRVQFTIGEKF